MHLLTKVQTSAAVTWLTYLTVNLQEFNNLIALSKSLRFLYTPFSFSIESRDYALIFTCTNSVHIQHEL